MTVLVGGGAADVTDVVNRVAADFPRTALFIVVTTYIVLFVLLRSAVLPIKALVMNTLSIVASFGALVWIFQDGNLSGPLGFQPLGFVETTQPVILFCVLFGLSMDYEVFLLSRMKEVWDRTDDNQEAVARGLERSGRIVTSAALIVVVVAASFAFADIVLIKALGIGMAIAVALDATVVRALLVPATMRLLGKWNWWAPALGPARAGGRRRACSLLVTRRCSPRAPAPILAAPPAAHPTTPPAATAAPRPSDPVAISLPGRRRAPRPPDRVVVLHRPPPRRRRRPLRLRVRDLPRRARRPAGVVGVAPRHHRRDRRHVPVRPADGIGPGVDTSPADGFGLAIPAAPAAPTGVPWAMSGGDGHDTLAAGAADAESSTGSGFALDLRVDATKPPALHDTDGWIDFGPAGGSYYYSRTAMAAGGTLTLGGQALAGHRHGLVRPPVGRLHRGRRRRLGLVRGQPVGRHRPDAFARPRRRRLVPARLRDDRRRGRHGRVVSTATRSRSRSPTTGRARRPGATYPAGWRITIPGEGLAIDLHPTVADQELDTRASTGVVYWEGSQVVSATRGATRLGGEAYVELTGYAPSNGVAN